MQTQACGELSDIYWANFNISHFQRSMRHVAAVFITFMLIIFWAIPVTFVASLTTLNSLSSQPGLGWISSVVDLSPILKGFLEGFLPTLALIIFMALLPLICKGLPVCSVCAPSSVAMLLCCCAAFHVLSFYLAKA